jgi:hypothetical protein
MKLEVFEKIIGNIRMSSEKDSKIYALGIDLINYHDLHSETVSLLLKTYYGEEGADWIDWFIYEKFQGEKEPLKAYDAEKVEICKDIKGLWELVEEIRNDGFDDITLPKEMSFEERMEAFEKMFGKT